MCLFNRPESGPADLSEIYRPHTCAGMRIRISFLLSSENARVPRVALRKSAVTTGYSLSVDDPKAIPVVLPLVHGSTALGRPRSSEKPDSLSRATLEEGNRVTDL